MLLGTGVSVAGAGVSRIARDVRAIVALSAEHAALRAGGWRRRRKAAAKSALDRADEIGRAAQWQAAAVGAVASLPTDPVLGVAASLLEAALLAEIEARAAAKLVALAAGDVAVAQGSARWDLGALRAGLHRAAGAVAEDAVSSIARAAARELCLALPRFGLRALLGPVAPVVEAAWGGAWSAAEMGRRLAPLLGAAREVELGGAIAPAANVLPFARPVSPSAWNEATAAAA